MKRFLCFVLSVFIALSLTGCRLIDKIREVANELYPATVPATERPSESEAPAETEKPSETPAPSSDPEADAAFARLDLEIFRDIVTSSASNYNQYIVSDPGKFGIDPADVEPGWGELTYEAHMESIDSAREVLDKLHAIDRDSLSELNRYGYDAIERAFSIELEYKDYYYYSEPLEPMNGTHTMLPIALICFSIRTEADIESYLFLVDDLARMIGQIERFEVEKAERGLFMCETALDQVVLSCRSFASKGEDSILITCFDEVADKAKELGLSDSEIAEITERNRKAVLNKVLPAYAQLADTLEAHRSDCSPFVGAARRSEEAKAYFELCARDEGATLDDMAYVSKLVEDMGDSVYEEFVSVIYRNDSVFDKVGDDISFGSVEKNVEWLESFIKEYYPPMPEYSLKYVGVPDDIADDFSPAAYLTASFDDYYDNVMLINPGSEGSDDLLTTAHETIPGHMYQFLYARNTEGLSLTQQIMEPTGYAEAWTVFTEHFVASRCRELDSDFCTFMNTYSTFTNIFLPAFISIKVNSEGWDLSKVKGYLRGYNMAEAADIYYEYAVTMPTYAMPYAIGFAYLSDIYSDAHPYGSEENRAFFEKYLSFGPGYMDMIRRYMEA